MKKLSRFNAVLMLSWAVAFGAIAIAMARPDPVPAWARWVIDEGDAPVHYSSIKPRLLRGGWVVFRPGHDRGKVRRLVERGTDIHELGDD